MALIDTIRTTLRTVVGSAVGLGETWYYRTITSAPTAQVAQTYGSWTAAAGVVSGYHIAEVPETRTGRLVRRERQFIRISDAGGILPNGSQFSADQAGTLPWAIDELASSAGGTAKYLIGRAYTERAQSNRGGGP